MIRTPAVALFLLLMGVYSYFYQAGGWNQNSRFDLVRAVVEQGTFVIDRYQHNTGDDSVRDGHYYCDKAPGASALCVPVYWLTYRLSGAPDPVSSNWLAWAVWIAIVLAIGTPSAMAATFLARLAVRFGLSVPAAYGLALLAGLGTMMLPYSTLLYGNQLAGSLMTIALALLVEIRQGVSATPRRMLIVGALLGYAAATEYPAVLIGGPIALYGWHVAGWRNSRFAVIGGSIPMVLLLAYHWVSFGSPFAFPYDYSVWPTPHTGWFMGIGVPRSDALSNVLFGAYRGLFNTTPWLLAAVPGAVVLLRKHRIEAIVCIWAVLAFLWLNSSIPPWDGGWAAGPRYLVPMLPFLSLLAGSVFLRERPEQQPAQRSSLHLVANVLFMVLAVFSVANMFAVTAVKPEISTAEKRPYAQMVWPNFRAGELAISTQSIDMIDNPPDAPRQAWNLGMKMGLRGHASLLPLYLWVLGWLIWLGVLLLPPGRSTLPSVSRSVRD
jgi:hypothetical protein